ncbi:hypothetical protein SLA2020_291900 [Shorea laevis]
MPSKPISSLTNSYLNQLDDLPISRRFSFQRRHLYLRLRFSPLRVARLNGFRRVFAHVASIFFEREIANPETKEISSLSVEPCEGRNPHCHCL